MPLTVDINPDVVMISDDGAREPAGVEGGARELVVTLGNVVVNINDNVLSEKLVVVFTGVVVCTVVSAAIVLRLKVLRVEVLRAEVDNGIVVGWNVG